MTLFYFAPLILWILVHGFAAMWLDGGFDWDSFLLGTVLWSCAGLILASTL